MIPRGTTKPTPWPTMSPARISTCSWRAFYEAEIRYNAEKKEWEVFTVGGGFTSGVGVGFSFSVNAMAGPVPLTATFELGGAIQLDFRTAVRYGQQGQGTELAWSDPTATAVNDFLTTLRINAYVHAFGGIGFDYSVVALKIGLFGNLDVDSQNKFLSRTYLADETKRQINGQALGNPKRKWESNLWQPSCLSPTRR